MIDKVMSIVMVNSEHVGSSVVGSITESLINPRNRKDLVGHLLKALFVGWALAVFVSPAISDRFKLTENESVAVCFVGGYFGIRMLSATEKIVMNRLNKEAKD